jgi:hypothetical protein
MWQSTEGGSMAGAQRRPIRCEPGRGGLARRWLVLTLGLVALATVVVATAGGGMAHAGDRGGTWIPPADTAVRVHGTAPRGFTVHFYDGAVWHLPTRSEARTECEEYHRLRRRVRCRTEVRIWYRDLGDLKRSLRYVRQQLR